METQLLKKNTSGVTDTILMIEPIAFGFNTETAVNNFFQKKGTLDSNSIQQRALDEFKNMTEVLKNAGVTVITVQDTPFPHTPDSIFPNNWISFHLNNHVVFYPMYAENRRLERRMDILIEIENKLGRKFIYTDYSASEMNNVFLEGTGSMVLDRTKRIAYAGLSPRTDKDLFLKFCREMDFKPVCFNATQIVNGERMPVYHTNVIMCMADQFVVVCLDTLSDRQERDELIEQFDQSGKTIVEITVEQMNNFAGNMIQLKNKDGEKLLIMSQTASDSLTGKQTALLESFCKRLVIPVPTIEHNGGGSVRCMIAEVF